MENGILVDFSKIFFVTPTQDEIQTSSSVDCSVKRVFVLDI